MVTYGGGEFEQIGGLDKGWYERQFDKEEILHAVRNLQGNKAPSPNGFSMTFFSSLLASGGKRCTSFL